MRYLVDTNVLLRLLQRNDPKYTTIRQVVRTLMARGDDLCCAPQNIVEFWNVCTRPASARGGFGLRGSNIKLDDDSITLTGKVKGGDYIGREVRDPLLRDALVDYLSSSGRQTALTTDLPLWTRHDRAGRPGAALCSHAFVKNLKRYAREAGVGDVHLHQARHSFARIVAEETGSLTDTQEALGHRNTSTTLVYVQRISVKRDKHSQKITARLKLNG